MRRVSASAGKLYAKAVAGDCCGAEWIRGMMMAKAQMAGTTIDLKLIMVLGIRMGVGAERKQNLFNRGFKNKNA